MKQHFSRHILVILFGLSVWSMPTLWAAPRSEAEIVEAVKVVIMNRHPDDTPEWWRGLGPGAPAAIIQVYESDPSTYHHMRLIEGLGAFGDDPKAVDFIKQQAERSTDEVVRNDVIRVIGNTQGAKEEEFLNKYLQHENPHTRLAAAEALKKINTPSAATRLEGFVAREQMPWVLAKFKGESSKPNGPLLPSGSSEDRLTSDFTGTWHGYWVSPKQDAAKGMKSEIAELHLAVQGVNGLTGDLRLTSQHKLRILNLGGVTGKGNHWSGNLIEAAASAKIKHDEIPCEAELLQQAGSFLMQIRLPRVGALVWLRRD